MGSARGDSKRECHLQEEHIAVTDLGCFETMRVEWENVIGTSVCLILSDTEVCSGILVQRGMQPESGPIVLYSVNCSGNGNTITFKGAERSCPMHGRCGTHHYSFAGVLAGDRLRGTYVNGQETTKVSWKRTSKPFATAAFIRKATERSCHAE